MGRWPIIAACLGVQQVGVLAPIPLGGALGYLFALGLWDAPGGGAFSLDFFALATLSFPVFLVLLGSVCVSACCCLS